jgi:hypothetical protein
VLLDLEHREYLAAVQKSLDGAKDARIVLDRAVQKEEPGGEEGRDRQLA